MGHVDTMSTVYQGRKNPQRLHNYAYGASKKHLRPQISELSDLEHLASLHKPTRTWARREGLL